MCPVLDPAMVTTVNFFHGNVFYTARRAKLAWLLLARHWAFLGIQDGGSHHLGYVEISHRWSWWPTWSCNTSFLGWLRAGVHIWSYFVDTWSMSRSNRRSNVKFGSKIIYIFVSSQSATSQRNRLPTSVMLFPNLSQWSCLLKIGSASSVRVTTRELYRHSIPWLCRRSWLQSRQNAMNYTKLFQKLKYFLLTSHATVNILQRVETISRKSERTHWLTMLCPKDCWSPNVVTLYSSETVCCMVMFVWWRTIITDTGGYKSDNVKLWTGVVL